MNVARSTSRRISQAASEFGDLAACSELRIRTFASIPMLGSSAFVVGTPVATARDIESPIAPLAATERIVYAARDDVGIARRGGQAHVQQRERGPRGQCRPARTLRRGPPAADYPVLVALGEAGPLLRA